MTSGLEGHEQRPPERHPLHDAYRSGQRRPRLAVNSVSCERASPGALFDSQKQGISRKGKWGRRNSHDFRQGEWKMSTLKPYLRSEGRVALLLSQARTSFPPGVFQNWLRLLRAPGEREVPRRTLPEPFLRLWIRLMDETTREAFAVLEQGRFPRTEFRRLLHLYRDLLQAGLTRDSTSARRGLR